MTEHSPALENTRAADPPITGDEVPSSYLAPPAYEMYPARHHRKPLRHDDSAETSYLFGSSGVLDRPAWSDSMGGRAVIRLISRGIVGAAFFTLGGHYANIKIRNYEPEVYGALNWQNLRSKPLLQTIAKGVDAGPGWLIKTIFRNEELVRFHPRENFHDIAFGGFHRTPENLALLTDTRGRSLGAEVVQVTFNFFSASLGDALTRNIIQAFDPNVKQPWIVDEKGQATIRGRGTFDAAKWVAALGHSSWRIFSKNAMEDWAAALPYVYQMKWQRQAINNIKPKHGMIARKFNIDGRGFKRAADANINGAMANVDAHGNVGSGYQWAGALDLHWRFVGYNWYTLMYREGYDTLARGFKQWQKNGFAIHVPPVDHPVTAAVDWVTQSLRYVTKSFIKANIYMQPAVIPFWLMRVPQSKWRGKYRMDASYGVGDKRDYHTLRTESGADYPRARLIHMENWPPAAYLEGQEVLASHSADPNFIKNIANPYNWNVKRNWFDTMLNGFGAVSYATGSGLTHAVDKLAGAPGELTRSLLAQTHDSDNLLLGRERMLRNFVDAGFSYYPYMYAKAETALRVDDRKNTEALGKMDKEIYSWMDSLGRLNVHDLWQSTKNIAYLSTHQEGDLISREGHTHLLQGGGDGTVVPNQPDTAKPPTMVQANSIQRAPIDKANDNLASANDNGPKTWAASVGKEVSDAHAHGRHHG